jgi:serine/threonine-protein kinase
MSEPGPEFETTVEPAADSLDRALADAFGGSPDTPSALSDSVLAGLRRALGVEPQVRLRQPEDDPPVQPQSPEMPAPDDTGRYQLLGELGRGGMGAVLKGRDVDLGRDLAVKVLLEKHRDNPEVARRFVEEAQIGGQLQHPGVVPVYELGQFPDRRPFFTMKLIKGCTLAALLARRPGPAQDRPRFLKVFEAVCQTVAYAHSRGVIHRDLKPGNVMVGAFGEVQVMDWGLAKVLGEGRGARDEGREKKEERDASSLAPRPSPLAPSSDRTHAGQLLGTPAYMAPEQARGETDRLDARADVFGLGAILCEILTGQPPYAPAQGLDACRLAARGDLAGALVRLEGCGADAELVALAKRCLAPLPDDRPQDAAAAAAELTAYLEGVEARLRQAELERAAAETRIVEERKRRRVQLALAASVLLTALLGGGGWLWAERAREARVARTSAEANEALSQALLLIEQAREAPVTDPAPWARALAALDKAESALAAGEADAATQARVAEARRTAEEEAREARQDRRMLLRLDKIWEEGFVLDQSGLLARRMEASLAEAFRLYGIELSSLVPAKAAQRLRQRRIKQSLAAALERWAFMRVDLEGKLGPNTAKLLETARLTDPAPWREELHAVWTRGKMEEVVSYASRLDVRVVPPAITIVLSNWLRLAHRKGIQGSARARVGLLARAHAAHPSDFTLAYSLGHALAVRKVVPPPEAVRYLAVARSLRPESAFAALMLGMALVQTGQAEEGLALVRRARQLEPRAARPHAILSIIYRDQNKLAESIAAREEAVRLDPSNADYLAELGGLLMLQGRTEAALAKLRQALVLAPDCAAAHCNWGALLARTGAPDQAVAHYRRAIKADPRSGACHIGLATSLLGTGKAKEAAAAFAEGIRQAPTDLALRLDYGVFLLHRRRGQAALAQFDEALKLDPTSYEAHIDKAAVFADYNQSRAALTWYLKAIELKPRRPEGHCGVGRMLFRLGDGDRALVALDRAYELDQNSDRTVTALARVLERKRGREEAIRFLRQALARSPNLGLGHAQLGAVLLRSGRPAEAVVALETARKLEPRNGKVLAKLGIALSDAGRPDEAVAACRKAVRLDEGDRTVQFSLGLVLFRQGKFREALPSLERSRELGKGTPSLVSESAEMVRICREGIELDGKLTAVLRGEVKLSRPEDMVRYALFCQEGKYLYAASARLYREAFVAKPELAEVMKEAHRFAAACAAALAGSGQGKDAAETGEAERAAWRRQALDWLRADLRYLAAGLEKGNGPRKSATVVRALQLMRSMPPLASIRDPAALARLSADEQESFRKFWADVEALLQLARR